MPSGLQPAIAEAPVAPARNLHAQSAAAQPADDVLAVLGTTRDGLSIAEVAERQLGLSRTQAEKRAEELLALVGMSDPPHRMKQYPHEMSGGLRQRAMIAMAIASEPPLLIADEPTTALDVTIQAQILDLLLRLRKETGMGVVLITHDMGVVAETADRVVVQYAGQQVESNTTRELFRNPHHPYTAALLAALPERAQQMLLPQIPGVVPGQFDRPAGCLFTPRCRFAFDLCGKAAPVQAGVGLGRALCHTPLIAGKPQRQKVSA